jgi:hypothetical protein
MVTQHARREEFEAFSERTGTLQDQLDQSIRAMCLKIAGLGEEEVLSTNEEEYLDILVQCYVMQVPELRYDEITYDRGETTISRLGAGRHNSNLPDHLFERKVPAYRFYIPASGPTQYLKYAPSIRLLWTLPVVLDEGQVSFGIVADDMDSEKVNRDQERIVENLKTQLGYIAVQIAGYNASLRDHAKREFDDRKVRAQRNRDLDGGIKVPPKR